MRAEHHESFLPLLELAPTEAASKGGAEDAANTSSRARLTMSAGSVSPTERQARERALEVIALMRRGHSLTSACAQARTTPYLVRKYAGSALERSPAGHWAATESDEFVRHMRAITTQGLLDFDIKGSSQATLVAQHANAVKHFLATGETEELRTFRGRTVAGKRLETDPDKLEDFANQGELEFEDIYQS